ncbi:YlbD family protein [Bacillus subtilis]|uniref:YlbD family protein n=1 Tax=Bacillus subtilis TaxID=1423 RepID=UPI001065A70E|nr:YlbD family protein [Bacillus subtilis]MEC1363769.1 YlbD family protein [Bacillus subtilis]MEC1380693.1 YlbD family protein [Bacillus subtilis]MEC4030629.1 YlbD family protein [Bacillus subtilis]MED1820311.1 YlbD family protein [Bacillus subtilis]TDY57732.1 putative coat protein YlbD-like [Bacillus subtilis]
MANQHANHSINDFKQFVKKHPKLIKEVRKEQRSWQDVYENWVLFGESDPIWDPYRELEEASEAVPETPQKNDFVSKMVTAVKKMDVNQMNEQINKMSQSISSLQSLLNTFSGSGQKHSQPGSGQHPFSFRKD